MTPSQRLGGVIHTYQKYDPLTFPSPTKPPPDLVSPALEHMLMFGGMRRLTPEELAKAIHLDPSQIAGLGPSLDMLLAMLLERKRKILAKYETDTVQEAARDAFQKAAAKAQPPKALADRFHRAIKEEQIRDLERLWYAAGGEGSKFALELLRITPRLGDKYQVDELASRYDFTGREPLTIPEAIATLDELKKIDELLKQLEEARETAQIAIIDTEMLSEFVEPGDLERLAELQQMVENYLKEAAERQGLESDASGFHLTPQAYRLFQGKLLEKIFANLEAARRAGRCGPVVGEGAVELERTKPYEFGDSLTHLDLPQSFLNALLRNGPGLPIRLTPGDMEIHRTRNTPKCATVVIMDMSGSMRYDGQYINVKRMALALDGLIRREYPGDYLHFIEMYTFARVRRSSEIVELMPKFPTIHDPVVRFKIDMSRTDVSEHVVPAHFTNIQHSLQLARRLLANQDTPNRQIILITDGLPTAHFDGSWLYLLYPPDPLTEAATMREGKLCQKDGVTINLFLAPSWSQSEEDIRFAYRLAESTKGRVFFTAGRDLDRYVVWDYVNRKREIVA